MMKSAKKLLSVLVLLGLFAMMVSLVSAGTESVNVEPGKEFVRMLPLKQGDHVTVTMQVMGSAPNLLHFYVLLPSGMAVDYGTKSESSVSFSTDVKGDCQLHFVNEGSDSQFLTVNYEIEHYVLGIPILIFVLIGISVVLIFVVAGYIIMGKFG